VWYRKELRTEGFKERVMPKISGIVVCVNYEDLLKLTLIPNMRFFHRCVVVTSTQDTETFEFAKSVPGVDVIQTDAFYRHGARFNKGLAIEEGFAKIREEYEPEWILGWDADILFPFTLNLSSIQKGFLYNCPRRIVEKPEEWDPNARWSSYPVSNDRCWPGYFQLFHSQDPIIKNKLPWHDTTFSHAGGGDGYFESRWPSEKKVKLQQDVLHFGPRDTNWFGRATKKIGQTELTEMQVENRRLMSSYLGFKGWRGGSGVVEEFNEKVHFPGAPKTGYRLMGRKDR